MHREFVSYSLPIRSTCTDLILNMRRVVGSPWITDFWCSTFPEVEILGADQKEHGLCEPKGRAPKQNNQFCRLQYFFFFWFYRLWKLLSLVLMTLFLLSDTCTIFICNNKHNKKKHWSLLLFGLNWWYFNRPLLHFWIAIIIPQSPNESLRENIQENEFDLHENESILGKLFTWKVSRRLFLT